MTKQCEITKFTQEFTMTLWRDKIKSAPIAENIIISAKDCEEMVVTKSCKHDNQVLKMTGSDNKCLFRGKIEEKFEWWTTIINIYNQL